MVFDYTREPGLERLERGQDTSGSPLVSIITPFYNAGKYFEQTFRCVMNQTFPWFEWIIVDDGSTVHDSVSLLQEMVQEDNRITVFTQANRGQSAARNRAAEKSRTEILVPLDADDLIAPTFLEELYWTLHFNPLAGWAYSDSVGFGIQDYQWIKPFSAARMKEENLLVCTAAIRRSAFERVGGYDMSEKHYDEDWHLWLRLLGEKIWPVHISGCLFWYRRSNSGMLLTVQHDSELRYRSKQMILQAAERVDTAVCAKEYPVTQRTNQYNMPKASMWNRKMFKSHNKTRVILLLPWLEMGGADLFNLDICRKIDKSKFEVSILTTIPTENSWRQRFEEHVTDIFDLTSFLDIKDYPEFISYFIKSREIDVLFLSNSYYGYYLLPWLRKEFPELAIVDYVHMEEWYWRNGGYARISGAMGEILEKTYVCNEGTRRVLIEQFGRAPESVETLYIGVDAEDFDPAKVAEGKAREEAGIGEERPIVLFPCRLHPQKRPFLMLDIAEAVRKRLPKIAFMVVGDGPQMEALQINASERGLTETVYFMGRQSDMRPYYLDSALTLICSLKEGLALTAYESLSMGKPVVTSDVGGQAELVDESVGRVLPLLQSEAEELDRRDFPPEEVQQYADAIVELLSDDAAYDRLCAACRERILSGFSSQLMIHKLENILDRLCTDGAMVERRRNTANHLGHFPFLTEELLLTYGLYEAGQSECEEVWRSREWFRGLYEAELVKHSTPSEPTAIPTEEGEAQRQLAEIYQMRSWKLVQKYRYFMDYTMLGGFFRKMRSLFRKK